MNRRIRQACEHDRFEPHGWLHMTPESWGRPCRNFRDLSPGDLVEILMIMDNEEIEERRKSPRR